MSDWIFNIFFFTLLTRAATATDLSSQLSLLEAQMDEVSTNTVEGVIGAKTAPAAAEISEKGWFLSVDLLYWHANPGGSEYATRFESSSKASPISLDFGWDLGFRLGIGTTFSHDEWDLYANFTRFQTDKSSATSVTPSDFIVPAWGPGVGEEINQASDVKANWRIQFTDIDLNLGRFFFLSRTVALHPFIGIKSAWIWQNAQTQADLFSPLIDRLKLNVRNDFWGIGPVFGIEGKWFIFDQLSLKSSFAGSLLLGDVAVREKQRLVQIHQTTFDVTFDRHLVVPTLQMQIGMGYEMNLYENKTHLSINLLYEYQYFWQANQMPYFTDPGTFQYKYTSEDLSLEGLTLNVRLDF